MDKTLKTGLLTDSTAELEIDPRRLYYHRGLRSSFLYDDRDVFVYVPREYSEQPDTAYPLLLMHDGQNLFDPETSFVPGRTWRLLQQAEDEIAAGRVRPFILCGVDNTGPSRLEEYTHSTSRELGGGKSTLYGQLLCKELLPMLRERYRLLPGREQMVMGGSSLGALASLTLGLKADLPFGGLALLSPSLWWNGRDALEVTRRNLAALSTQRLPRIWLTVGSEEGQSMMNDMRDLQKILEAAGLREGADFHSEVMPGGGHDETSWAKFVRPMLRFFFPAASAT